jgi:hypothetical protein
MVDAFISAGNGRLCMSCGGHDPGNERQSKNPNNTDHYNFFHRLSPPFKIKNGYFVQVCMNYRQTSIYPDGLVSQPYCRNSQVSQNVPGQIQQKYQSPLIHR